MQIDSADTTSNVDIRNLRLGWRSSGKQTMMAYRRHHPNKSEYSLQRALISTEI